MCGIIFKPNTYNIKLILVVPQFKFNTLESIHLIFTLSTKSIVNKIQLMKK